VGGCWSFREVVFSLLIVVLKEETKENRFKDLSLSLSLSLSYLMIGSEMGMGVGKDGKKDP